AFLNIIFFKSHLIAFYGEAASVFSTRGIQFGIETILYLILAGLILFQLIKNKELIKLNDIWKPTVILLVSLFALMPQTLLYNLFGNYGEVPKDFTITHIFVIIVPVVLMFTIYFVMRRKDQNDKTLLMVFLAFAGVFQYFYMRRIGLAALPLHLCNTAVILLFFALVFNIKSFFYFSYFANVLGAIAAIFLPNYSTDFFSFTVIHFGYNHLYALIVPILGVALHVFPKPVLSHMYKAILVFTVYFIVVVGLNAWFNNYNEVDYFFAYSDYLTDMFNIRELQYFNVVSFEYRGLTFTFYWLFQILYYLTFVFLMFASWFVYDASYQFADQRARLRDKQKQMKVDYLNLLELLGGRSTSEPMNLGGVDMIKITNFSKRYGKSTQFAVKNFSLEVPRGEIFGFLGHNGAGKSTTIKSLVGIQSITEGEMEICGYSIKSQPLEAKLRIGYVSDNHAVYEKLTGREYIHYVANLYRIDNETRDRHLNDLAKKLSLDHALDQMVKSYSHGMKQKLVVIASLIHEPPVWILDEPLTGLDPISSFQIKEIMKNYAEKGNIVFFSSHVIEVVEKICTKIAVITEGELTGVYDVSILKDKGISLEKLYMTGIQDKIGVSHD
ncbi:MAG: ATP-binding cassette domain-containing protein, partial [Acholeplasmataceae bacterium]